MSTPTLSVVVPTIAGREHHFDRLTQALKTVTLVDYELIVVRDKPGCGIGWQLGAEQSRGEYLVFLADDLEPHPGWDAAAIRQVDSGWQPAPRLLEPDGTPWPNTERWADQEPAPLSVVPFLRRDWWPLVTPMLPIHYFTDNWVSWRLAHAGIETRKDDGYLFTHHWASEHRDEDRMTVDQDYFTRTVMILLAGEQVLQTND